MPFDQNVLFTGAIQLLVLLLAISVHESAHAWTAAACGDPTARDLGRVTLNPLRHLDLFGSLLLPLMLLVIGAPLFGWAKPTPVDTRRLRDPHRHHLLVTAAGPASNLALAAAAALALAVAVNALGPEARQAAYLGLIGDVGAAATLAHFPLAYTLVQLAFLNAFLAFFNLIPVPPLDGGQFLLHLLPPEWAYKVAAIRPFGFMIVLGLAMLNVLSLLVLPIYVVLALIINL